MLKKLARTDPYYKRNQANICSFYVKGECNRGEECPYRHEMPVENDLSKQNMRDRYYGKNDPVAKKILAGHAAEHGLAPPEDTSIMSLFLTALPATVDEQSLRTALVTSLPSISPNAVKSVVHVAKNRCAFVNFRDRATAEQAAQAWATGVDIDGTRAGVRWGRSRANAKAGSSSDGPKAGPSSGTAPVAS